MKAQHTIKKRPTSLLVRSLAAVLVSGSLGFFVLFACSLFWWCSVSFKDAFMRVERLSMQERGLVNALQPLAWHLEGSTSRSFKNEWQHWHAQAAQTAHQFKQALDLPLQTLNAEFKATRASSSLTDFLSTLTTFFKRVYLLGCACAHVLWLKILLCIAAIPLFVLTSLAGLIDGLNQRAIRTASLGRESTYVFHKSLPLARKTLFWVLVMWLALPFCFNPTGLFMGLSVGLAIVMSTSASRFKKYL